MDRRRAQEWLDRYVAAWETYDAESIGALFSDDVAYRYHPYDDPIVGRAAVVASWRGEGPGEGASTRDEPGTFEATYAPIAVDGDLVVAQGVTRYRKAPGDPVHQVYDNCFVMRFDDADRCREFTEFYVLRPS
ncbi:nuclear transport factor 2 family protein [Nocardioides sp. YIM 152315]|uniref:nuclear transport factor 2 family protein n=1 Tax=Nocardioides sp. YIM 152315 TaxID=3031760 RepID=UPI0023DB66D5|nr:nuclear transport factor 2 family protein [Nocardioides sp. YIM 152315]MDF1605287.1 nuclear transport factor 2 family protein [Nocardioides sp. YIM 152315]